MLLNDFFTVTRTDNSSDEIKVSVEINAEHKIFDCHFPGQPVVPGVCMMQMVKEILETIVDKKTNLTKAHEMKFLAVIDPTKNNIIDAMIKYSTTENKDIAVTASFYKDQLIHFKFKGVFAFA